MRLTLRNLLAYMDGNLRPEDSESIGKRIEENKFATDLYHKIRDVMRRIRLAAPLVNERSSNFDCNTVAEYLDNALPSERVVEFEETCLKSDMHLAEVAASHQILTVVQVEPAEIDPESRQRMYQLPKVAQQADEERTAAAEAATLISGDGAGRLALPQVGASTLANAPSRPKPVVPEYLREPKKPRLLLAAACVFIASAAIAILLMAFGQFAPDKPLGHAVAWIETKLGVKKPVADKPADASGQLAQASTDKSTQKSGTDSSAPVAAMVAAASSSSDASVAAPGKGSDATTIAGPVAPDSKTSASEPPALLPPEAAPGAIVGPGVMPAPTGSKDSAPPAVAANTPGNEKKPGLIDGSRFDTPIPGPKSTEFASAAGVKAPGPVNPAPGVGRFKSDGQDVLLKLEAATPTWRRVLPEEFLPAGQSLLALPSYRPRIDFLNVSATLKMLSGTKLDLAPPNAQGLPGVNLDYGRIVFEPLAQAGSSVRVTLGGHSGTLTLSNAESVVGFELSSIHEPGADPDKVPSHPNSMLYVAKGSAIWDEGDGKPSARLTAPIVWPLDAPSGQARESHHDMPDWITSNTTSDLEMRAALAVSQALPADRPAALVLMELADHPRIENRRLAARCLGHLGRFEPMVAGLNDQSYRSEWPDYIDQLREALSRGPESARAIRAALETKYGSNAPALYRMLWGYTDQDLGNEEDARLVKFLDSEDLVFRVLAVTNLKDLTGQSLGYRPEQLPRTRTASVARWRQQLAAGRVRTKATLDKVSDKVKSPAAPVGGVALPEDTGAANGNAPPVNQLPPPSPTPAEPDPNEPAPGPPTDNSLPPVAPQP